MVFIPSWEGRRKGLGIRVMSCRTWEVLKMLSQGGSSRREQVKNDENRLEKGRAAFKMLKRGFHRFSASPCGFERNRAIWSRLARACGRIDLIGDRVSRTKAFVPRGASDCPALCPPGILGLESCRGNSSFPCRGNSFRSGAIKFSEGIENDSPASISFEVFDVRGRRAVAWP